MTQYELMMIVKPSLEETAVKDFTAKVKGWIEAKSGTVSEVKEWGKKRFATPMDKLTEGYYVLVYYSGEGNLINSYLTEQFKISEEMVRHMIVVFDPNAVTKPVKRERAAQPASSYVQR